MFMVLETYLTDKPAARVYFSTEVGAWNYVRERLLKELRALLEREDRKSMSYGYYLDQLINLAEGDVDAAASEWAEPAYLLTRDDKLDEENGLTPLPGGSYLASIWVHPMKVDGVGPFGEKAQQRELKLCLVDEKESR